MTFEPKNANNIFLSKIWKKKWTDVHVCIVKLESGGQQLPIIKKNCSGNRFNLEKSSFLLNVLKTYIFTQITERSIVTHLHYPELNKECIFNHKQKKKSMHTLYTQKKLYFYQKITKIQLFDLKCAILNRHTYESRNMEMIDSQKNQKLKKFI